MKSSQPSFSRRALLRTGVVAAASLGAAPALAACGGGGGAAANGGAAASAQVTLPTYRPFEGVTPDFPGTAEGVQNGFLKMPAELIKSTTAKPLSGPVTALTETFDTPPTPMASNAFWKNLNTALGGDLNLTIGTDPGYPEKFATILAGGDLPDMMWVPPNQGIPNVAQMLEAKFTDLTQYLSGDAVLEYPNLAALKPDSWKTAVVNGKIWGAPIPSTPFGQVMLGNQAKWDKVGGLQCTSADEFADKCKQLLNESAKQYVLEPAYINMVHMFSSWFGAHDNWFLDESKNLKHYFEEEAYKESVAYAAKLFKAGYFYPDANLADSANAMVQGSIAAQVVVGPTAPHAYITRDPNIVMENLLPFGAQAGLTPIYGMGYGTVGYTAFKQADEAKTRQLLALINWLSAPFGTEEYLTKNYGVEGQQFERDASGNPVPLDSAKADVPGLVSALVIMSNCESVNFNGTHPEDVEVVHSYQQELIKISSQSAVKGLYSDTNTKVGPKITAAARDIMVDIVTGRKEISAWDDAVKAWRSDGGDKIREEYEKALA
ncbi:sugar ABC transporter substrate-binding protein [Micrococcales bacterium 31B]|nr:sugar ABC transporter substrate-binding protein [Micrococcales bacterium 31B]